MGGFLSELADDYKESAERSMRRQARRNGRQAGRDVGNVITGIPTAAISRFTSPVNARIENSLEYDQGYVRGAAREGRGAGRAAAQEQFGGWREEREHRSNGRRGSRDDLPYAPDGFHPSSSRGAEPAAQDRFVVSDGKFTYQIDNGGVPLTREQQRNIGAALGDIQSWGGKNEAGALRFALENGLSPDAIIVSSNGRAKSGVDVETFVKQGMMGGDQKNALAMLAQAERNPQTFYSPQEQSPSAAYAGANVGGRDNFALPRSQMLITNLLRDESVAPATRIEQLRKHVEGIDNRDEARQFHREIAANPNLINEYGALLEKAGISNADKTREIETLIAQQGRINRLDPEGAQMATQSMAGTSAYAQSYHNFNNTPTSAELSQVTIADEDLNKRLQAAVSQQKGWEDMAKSNPIAGMFMMLLRPLLNAMNPDSDPMRILAEASEKGVPINAPDAVKGKLAESLGDRANIQTTALAADNKAAEAPTPQELTANAPSQQESERAAAQVKEEAQQKAAGHSVASLSADNGENLDTAPSKAEVQQQSRNAALLVEVKEEARRLGIPVSDGNMVMTEADYKAIESAQAASAIPNAIRRPDENAPAAPGVPDYMGNLLAANSFTPPAGVTTNGQDICKSDTGTLAAGSAPNLAAQQQAACRG